MPRFEFMAAVMTVSLESFVLGSLNINCTTFVISSSPMTLLDKNDLIHCGGRIHNAPVTEFVKFLYLLLSKDPFTTLIILKTHKDLLHVGVNSALQQTYWILSTRQCIQALLQTCVSCNKVIGSPYTAPDPPSLIKLRMHNHLKL